MDFKHECCHETPICEPGPTGNKGDPEIVSHCAVNPQEPPGPAPGPGPGGFHGGGTIAPPSLNGAGPGPGPGPINPGPTDPTGPGPITPTGSIYKTPGNTPVDWSTIYPNSGATIIDGPSNVPSYSVVTEDSSVILNKPLNVPIGPTLADAFDIVENESTNTPLNELLPFDPETEIFDRDHTYLIPDDPDILSRATNIVNRNNTDNDIMGTFIPNFVNDVLRAGLGEEVPFDGTTIGAYLYSNITTKILSKATQESLTKLETANTTSLALSTYLKNAITLAVSQGTVSDYSQSLFEEILQGAKTSFPQGFPKVENSGSRSNAFGLVRQKKQSLDNKSYVAKGTEQRMVQMYRIVAPDIDLSLPVRTASGKVTSAAIGLNNKLKITKADGEVDHVSEINDFIKVRNVKGKQETIELKSNRNIAYNFDTPDLSVIQAHFAQQNSIQYGFTLSVSSEYGDEVEQGEGTTIEKGYLFTINADSIEDVPINDPYTRRTKVEYTMEWKDGDPDLTFNNIVGAHSGPRNTVYIPVDDPWWGHLLNQNAEGNFILDATFTDLDLDGFDGKVYPRRIPNDLLVVPSNVTAYNILQGGSTLEQYEIGTPVIRLASVIMNPLPSISNKGYVQTTKAANGLNQDGRPDIFAFTFQQNKNTKNKFIPAVDALVGPTTIYKSKPSPLGTVLNKIEDIKASYDLTRGRLGEGIPQGDLLTRFTMIQLIKYIAGTPENVRASVLEGTYNNIKIFPVKKTDTEKTFFTAARLKQEGTPQLPKKIPRVTGKYYPPSDKGKIGGFE